MKLINQSVECLPQSDGINGMYRQIEIAGRTCYKSEDKMTDNSRPFVERMIGRTHYAMLEHGAVYLAIPLSESTHGELKELCDLLRCNPYTKSCCDLSCHYFSTNYRVIVENGLQSLMERFFCSPTPLHEMRRTVKCVTDRGVWNELIRGRKEDRLDDADLPVIDYPVIDYDFEKVASFAQESTRYCNYSSAKFGNELTFIIPSWLDIDAGRYDVEVIDDATFIVGDNYRKEYYDTSSDCSFLRSCLVSEASYRILSYNGLKPEQARAVLSLSTKTEIVITAFESDWNHFFDLRLFGKTGKPHPDMKNLAEQIYTKFQWEQKEQ